MTTIEIACDNEEAAAFRDWLNAHGCDAKIGRTTGNYVDGVWTTTYEDASETMRDLWLRYCNAG